MVHSHLSEFLSDPENLRGFQQERLLVDVAALIYSKMKERGVNRKQLADLLGVSKGRVTQYLCGAGNLRLRTLADIFTALDSALKLEAGSLSDESDGWQVIADIPVSRAILKLPEARPERKRMGYLTECFNESEPWSLAS